MMEVVHNSNTSEETVRGLERLQEERALMKKLQEDLRERFPDSTGKWRNAPPPQSFIAPKDSTAVEYGSLWQLYGKGKLCEHDPNARSDLRRLQNDL